MLDKVTHLNHLNNLYDIYGQLLTNKQKQIFGMYYQDDLSLGEIADEVETSRQAVFDNLKRVEKILLGYEEKLNLYIKRKEINIVLDTLENSAFENDLEKIKELITLLKQNMG